MCADIATIKDIAAIAKDVIVAVAAVAAGSVAIYGINSWRRETSGKAQFDAAKAMLVATYKVRDEIAYCRSPLLVAGEFPPEFPLGAVGEGHRKGLAHVYSNRWAPVRVALEAFDGVSLDAEAVLGSQAKAAANKLRACGRSLFAGIEGYLSVIAEGSGGRRDEVEASFRRLIHSRSENDSFATELNNAIAEIEGVLSPHVQRAS